MKKPIKPPIKRKHRPMKYVRITDKITILVPNNIPDDVAREEFLLKIAARDRGYEKLNKDEKWIQ